MRGNYKHGGKGQRLYVIWKTMRQRCKNPNHKKYKNYGGRGIGICAAWNDYSAFKRWAMENGYRDDLTIDRIDVNGSYCPSNCKWSSVLEQENNKTNTLWIQDGDEEISMASYCRKHGLKYKRFWVLVRKRGMNYEEAKERSRVS